ncbi:hypothetical protein R6Q57_004060 [Mikania cordata]
MRKDDADKNGRLFCSAGCVGSRIRSKLFTLKFKHVGAKGYPALLLRSNRSLLMLLRRLTTSRFTRICRGRVEPREALLRGRSLAPLLFRHMRRRVTREEGTTSFSFALLNLPFLIEYRAGRTPIKKAAQKEKTTWNSVGIHKDSGYLVTTSSQSKTPPWQIFASAGDHARLLHKSNLAGLTKEDCIGSYLLAQRIVKL